MAVVLLGIEIIFLSSLLGLVPFYKLTALVLPDVLVNETNAARVSDQLGSLRLNPLLELAAQEKANDMAQYGYFSHISPAGLSPWHWFEKAGYDFLYAGENLAVNFTDSSDIIKAWMNSESHRANILNRKFTEIGIAAAQGFYKGRPAVFAVQFFGAPFVSGGLSRTSSSMQVVFLNDTSPKYAVKAPSDPSLSIKADGNMAVAVKGAESSRASSVAPTVTYSVEKPNIVKGMVASPRRTINYLFFSTAIFIVFSLLLNIFIKVRIQHGYLIWNGLFLLLFLGILLALNHYFLLGQMSIL